MLEFFDLNSNSTGRRLLVVARSMAVALQFVSSPFASAQPPVPVSHRFEVASIKPSDPGKDAIRIDIEGRHFNTQSTTLIYLIQFAYGLHSGQVIGGPQGKDVIGYDIAAVASADFEGEGQRPDRSKLMLQSLLEDRFKLRFHREQRERPAFGIVIAKNGPKLTKSGGDPGGHADFSRSDGMGKIVAGNATITEFAGILQDIVFRDQTVVDQTQLAGRYDFVLEFAPDLAEYRGRYADRPLRDDSPPSFYTAIQEQLGLKLESKKIPVDVLVIDHFEKPSEN